MALILSLEGEEEHFGHGNPYLQSLFGSLSISSGFGRARCSKMRPMRLQTTTTPAKDESEEAC